MNNRKAYRELIRRIAGVFALLFVYMAIITATHHHGEQVKPASTAAVLHQLTAKSSNLRVAVPTAKSPDTIFTGADCALCDWIATPSHTLPSVTLSLVVALSAIASVLLAVRIAALCAAPAPRRGLRAPPALSLA